MKLKLKSKSRQIHYVLLVQAPEDVEHVSHSILITYHHYIQTDRTQNMSVLDKVTSLLGVLYLVKQMLGPHPPLI